MQKLETKLFGTDGIRGIVGERITAGVVFRVGKALAVACRDNGTKSKIIVGRDTRTSGDMLESALCSGLTAFGADVVKLGIVPTPSLPYLITKTGATAGIMITASHNPPGHNGLKLFGSDGGKLPSDKELEIETIMANEERYLPNSYESLGNIHTDEDLLKLYADYILQKLGNVDLTGVRVYLDCSNGAAYRIAPYMFKTLGATVKTINASSNGTLINVNCGSESPQELQKAVVKEKFDIGFAFDGDADRVVAVSGSGELVRGDELLYILAKELKKQNILAENTVVGTVLTNFGLENALVKLGIKLERTPVGDKKIKDVMIKDGYSLGGEEAGHIILRDYNFTGDGVLTSLMITKILKTNHTGLEDEIKTIEKYPQIRIDVPVSDLVKSKVLKSTEVASSIEAAEAVLAEHGRVVVRPSGTESVFRIMLEGENMAQLRQLAKSIEAAVLKVK